MRKHPQQMSMIHASLGWVTWTSPSSHPTIVFPVRAPFAIFISFNWSFRPLTGSVRYFCAPNDSICDKLKEVDKLYQNNRCGQGHALWEPCMRSGNIFGWVTAEGRELSPRMNNKWKLIVKLFRGSGVRRKLGVDCCGKQKMWLWSRSIEFSSCVRCRGENWIIFSLSQASLWN